MFRDLLIQAADQSSAKVLVTFGHHVRQQTGKFFGMEFAAKYGIAAFGIAPTRNHWFQTDELDEALSQARAFAAGRPIVAYGASMGGYGALLSSKMLGAERVILAVPQVVVGPRAPWETRWPNDVSATDFKREATDGMSSVPTYILYDPYHRADARQVREIAALPNVVLLPMFYCGHHVLEVLMDAGHLSSLIMGLIDGSMTTETFSAIARHRKASPAYRATLALHLSSHRPTSRVPLAIIDGVIRVAATAHRARWQRHRSTIIRRKRSAAWWRRAGKAILRRIRRHLA